MVIDTRIVVAGSFNYTAPANEYNDENLFVIGSPTKRLTLCGSTWPSLATHALRRRRPLSPPTTRGHSPRGHGSILPTRRRPER